MKKQVFLPVSFQILGKEKQEIHFTNVDTNNEKIKVPRYGMRELPQKALKSLVKIKYR